MFSACCVLSSSVSEENVAVTRQDTKSFGGDFKEILKFAKHADFPYREKDEIEAVLYKINSEYEPDHLSFHSTETTRFVVVETDSDWTVCFRGTATFSDVVTDAKYLKYDAAELVDVPDVDIEAHRGFCKMAGEVYRTLYPLLKEKKNRPLNVTGHSLGGAVATLVAAFLAKAREDGDDSVPPLGKVIVFGAPKVTDLDGAKEISRLVPGITRVNREQDIVPFVPPLTFFSSIGGTYHHAGKCLVLRDPSGRRGSYLKFSHLDMQEVEDFREVESFWNALSRMDLSVAEHMPKTYIEVLQKFAREGADEVCITRESNSTRKNKLIYWCCG